MFPRSVPKVLESSKLTRQALHQSNVSAEVTGNAGPREGTWEQMPASAAEAAGSGDGLRLCPARLAGGGTCGLAGVGAAAEAQSSPRSPFPRPAVPAGTDRDDQPPSREDTDGGWGEARHGRRVSPPPRLAGAARWPCDRVRSRAPPQTQARCRAALRNRFLAHRGSVHVCCPTGDLCHLPGTRARGTQNGASPREHGPLSRGRPQSGTILVPAQRPPQADPTSTASLVYSPPGRSRPRVCGPPRGRCAVCSCFPARSRETLKMHFALIG